MTAHCQPAWQSVNGEVLSRALHSNSLTQRSKPFRWSIKVDRIGFLDAFADDDWHDVDEIIVDMTRDHPTLLREKLDATEPTAGPGPIRLALPPLTRKWEEKGLPHKIRRSARGRLAPWEAANFSAWSYLGLDPTGRVGHRSGHRLVGLRHQPSRRPATSGMGVNAFALSPEDGLANVARFWPSSGPAGGGDRPSRYAAVPGRIVRLRQPDRRLSRQGELQVSRAWKWCPATARR